MLLRIGIDTISWQKNNVFYLIMYEKKNICFGLEYAKINLLQYIDSQ